MWWTAILTLTGVIGLWLVAHHWQGWVLYLVNEVLWFIYAITIHAPPLIVMSILWGVLGARNLHVARKAHLQSMRTLVPGGARPDQGPLGRIAVRRLQTAVRPDQ